MIARSVVRPWLLGLFAALGAAGCGEGAQPEGLENSGDDIVQVASARGLSSMVEATESAGMTPMLRQRGAFTVFFPTNRAFAAARGILPRDPELFANVLSHHVLRGGFDFADLSTGGPFTTVAKTSLTVDASSRPVTVGGAALSRFVDLRAGNGILHIMDEVIIPPTIVEQAVATPDLSTLVSAVQAASSAVQATLQSDGPLTVFAPTNAAFAASGIDLTTIAQADLDRVLSYHVVAGQNTANELSDGQVITMASGDRLTVNISGGSVSLTDAAGNRFNVVTTDIRLLNGVVHVIDGVLDPTAPNPGLGNIVQVASGAGVFGTLLSAATAVGLDTVLADPNVTLTVFAPTDAAFSALGVNLAPVSSDVVANILLQHVIGEDVPASRVLTSPTLTTAANLPLEIDASGTPVTIGGADLGTTLDVLASNGRVHFMDEVIVPPTILQTAASLPDFTSLVAAVGQASAAVQDALAPDTLAGDAPITVFAPTNAAFANSGIDLAHVSQEDLDLILAQHAAIGQALSSDLADGQVVPTLSGNVTVNIRNGRITLTSAGGTTVNVIATDVRTLTGVIHVIDGVLFPAPDLIRVSLREGLIGFFLATRFAGLTDTLTDGGPFTVFAPSNRAFAALGRIRPSRDVLANILLHHVVPGTFDANAVVAASSLATAAKTSLAVDASGQPITIGGADLSNRLNRFAANGIIHVMDEVIVPPTIVEVAQATPSLSTLVSALVAARLVNAVNPDTLSGDAPLTVFAPSNAAFQAAGVDLNNPPANLSQILTYHVVSGQVLASDLSDGQIITTVEGSHLEVDIDANGNVSLIDGAGSTIAVSTTDIRTLTGVVHLIDGVLLPH